MFPEIPAAASGPADAGPSPATRLGGLGFEMAGYVIVAGGLGYGLDVWLKTGPWLLVGGLIFGIVGGGVRFVREGLAANRSATRAFQARHGPKP